MADPAITVERLSRAFAAPGAPPTWALRDVTFGVEPGEAVGLLGPNGAGKTTLLRVLNGTLGLTSGHVRLVGRPATAMGWQCDFDPELTGRENVYFRGAALGMTRSQVGKRLDELVAFSGLERFVDTPTKYYGLGMSVLLALAIATHLASEHVFVDEILSWTDQPFQQKCLGRLRHLSAVDGKAVLFVTQDVAAVQRVCKRAILLRDASLVADGPSVDVAQEYLTSHEISAEEAIHQRWERPNPRVIRLASARVADRQGATVRLLATDDDAAFEVGYQNDGPTGPFHVAMSILDLQGRCVMVFDTKETGGPLALARSGTIALRIPELPLRPGRYHLSVAFKPPVGEQVLFVPIGMMFGIRDAALIPAANLPSLDACSVRTRHQWAHRAAGSGTG